VEEWDAIPLRHIPERDELEQHHVDASQHDQDHFHVEERDTEIFDRLGRTHRSRPKIIAMTKLVQVQGNISSDTSVTALFRHTRPRRRISNLVIEPSTKTMAMT